MSRHPGSGTSNRAPDCVLGMAYQQVNPAGSVSSDTSNTAKSSPLPTLATRRETSRTIGTRDAGTSGHRYQTTHGISMSQRMMGSGSRSMPFSGFNRRSVGQFFELFGTNLRCRGARKKARGAAISGREVCRSSTRSESSIAGWWVAAHPLRATATSALKRRAGLGGHSRPEYPARNCTRIESDIRNSARPGCRRRRRDWRRRSEQRATIP